MKKWMLAMIAVLSMSALITGGCANKEVVKSDEGLLPKAAQVKEETKPVISKPAETVRQVETVKPVESTVIVPAQSDLSSGQTSLAESSFETVYFDFDKSDLRQDARDALSRNAEVMLKSKSGAKIQIEGHCDERGSAEYNLALGERRANSSLQYLVTMGVKADRLSIISYGKEKPAVQGNSEAAWAKNRRSEFVVAK